MASILDRYGIKEVADVTFYSIDENGNPEYPVLYLDTLKVSTIEQTAESTDAKGGKGNAPLITWDYGKEINVTLEDALFSAKSMAIMFSNGQTKTVAKAATLTGDDADTDTASNNKTVIMKTEQFTLKKDLDGADITGTTGSGNNVVDNADGTGWSKKYTAPDGRTYNKLHPKFYKEDGSLVASTALEQETTYFCTYDIEIKDATVIDISADSFPGTYYVTGDTFARSEMNGKDEFFQFIIPKAKVTSENTITLEAEGDPSVFNMNLKVLRPKDGVMMKLVKYNLAGGNDADPKTTTELIHKKKKKNS